MPEILLRHPETPCTAIERIEAELAGDGADALRLTWRLLGAADRVLAPPAAEGALPQRRDELWRHTCCELFIADAEGAGYRELNFAPSGDWAAYRFASYRADRVPLDTGSPRIALRRSADALELEVTLEAVPLEPDARIGLACIVETEAGLSYWALAHPPGRPDFHHPSAFALTPRLAHTAGLST